MKTQILANLLKFKKQKNQNHRMEDEPHQKKQNFNLGKGRSWFAKHGNESKLIHDNKA